MHTKFLYYIYVCVVYYVVSAKTTNHRGEAMFIQFDLWAYEQKPP